MQKTIEAYRHEGDCHISLDEMMQVCNQIPVIYREKAMVDLTCEAINERVYPVFTISYNRQETDKEKPGRLKNVKPLASGKIEREKKLELTRLTEKWGKL